MTDVVSFSRALSDPTRWRIIRLVMDQALCVCELADILGMPQSSVSSHVQVIRKAGLLEGEKCEKWTYFRIEARYLAPIQSLIKAFPEELDSTFQTDEEAAVKRLEKRETSCCPGPRKMKSRRRNTTLGKP